MAQASVSRTNGFVTGEMIVKIFQMNKTVVSDVLFIPF